MKKQRPKVDDPLRRPCSACGARVGQGCKTVGADDTRRTYASRLVHAARLEGENHA